MKKLIITLVPKVIILGVIIYLAYGKYNNANKFKVAENNTDSLMSIDNAQMKYIRKIIDLHSQIRKTDSNNFKSELTCVCLKDSIFLWNKESALMRRMIVLYKENHSLYMENITLKKSIIVAPNPEENDSDDSEIYYVANDTLQASQFIHPFK